MMRVKDFFYTIVISTITSLILIIILISAGVLQIPRSPTTYQIEQTVPNSSLGSFDDGLKKYVISETIYLQNVTTKASLRVLHFFFEFNETGVSPKLVSLIDQETQETVFEKKPIESYSGNLIIDTSLRADRAYYISIEIEADYPFTFIYKASIIQDIYL